MNASRTALCSAVHSPEQNNLTEVGDALVSRHERREAAEHALVLVMIELREVAAPPLVEIAEGAVGGEEVLDAAKGGEAAALHVGADAVHEPDEGVSAGAQAGGQHGRRREVREDL